MNSRVDRSVIYIGDEIKYTIIIKFSEDMRIEKPGPGANLGSFEIKDYHLAPLREERGVIIEEMAYTIIIFETGEFTIPPLVIRGKIAEKWQEIRTDTIKIYVKEITKEQALTNDIIDIKEQEEIEIEVTKTFLVLVIIIGILLITGVVLLLLYRYRQKQKEEEIPYYDEALYTVKELLKKRYFIDKKYREFYYELSHILKKYLERRYSILCTVLLTSEIIREFEERGIEYMDFYRDFFKYADLVKFAKYIPEEQKTKDFLKEILEIIKQEKEMIENRDDTGNGTGEEKKTKKKKFLKITYDNVMWE
ncbi:hypothetical protein ACFL6D_04390 [Spirochaetota bacterium]